MFPSTLDNFTPKTDNTDDVLANDVNELQTAIESLETKVGVDNSADASSLDKKVSDLETNNTGVNTGDETSTSLGSKINSSTEKTAPVDADMVGLMDSGASNILKKLSWANIKATLKSYFDTLYTLANLRPIKTGTFLNGSTTYVQTDADVNSNSIIDVYAQSTPIGSWSVSSSNGQFTITSTKVETADVTFKYFINN